MEDQDQMDVQHFIFKIVKGMRSCGQRKKKCLHCWYLLQKQLSSRKRIDKLTFSRYIIYSKFDQSNIVYHSRMSGMIADFMPGHWQWPSTLLLAVANILLIFQGYLRLTEIIFRLTEIDSKVLLILDSTWLELTHINGNQNVRFVLLSASCGFDSRRKRCGMISRKCESFRFFVC